MTVVSSVYDASSSSVYFYRIITYFNSMKIMSLNWDAKKEEEKTKKYNKK